MRIKEALISALGSLRVNKLRTILTMLGIIIGVTAVVALLSIGEGVQNEIQGQIQGMGPNLLAVAPGSMNRGGVQMTSSAPLTMKDAEAIADPRNVPHAAAISVEFMGSGQLVYGSQNTSATIDGTDENYMPLRNVNIASGRFLATQDVKATSNVVVLGATVADNLFPGVEPVGKTVRINKLAFRVIGVLEKKGGAGFGSEDDYAFVPVSTVQQKLFASRTAGSSQRRLSLIDVQATSADTVETAAGEVTLLMRQRHNVDADHEDFMVITQADLIGTFNQITGILTFFLAAIAGISLLVGGIGIMNIMLVSVTERTREIGIRKAVGAKRRDILLQFLVEATFVSLSGGIVGAILGASAAQLVKLTGLIQPVISIQAIVLALGFSAVVGLFFGIYPARRAARLNPIDALRYE